MASPNVNDSFVLCDVSIFTGDRFIDSGYIIVHDGRIIEIQAGEHTAEASNAPLGSFPGFTVLPGLIDSHTHGLGGNTACIEQPIRFGVTTVCDMHNEPNHIISLKVLSASDKGRYSDFKCAGVGATVPGGWPEPVVLLHGRNSQAEAAIASGPKVERVEDAEPFVESQVKENGAEYIKIFSEAGDTVGMSLSRPSVEVQKAIVEAAHRRGLLAVGHAFSHAGALDLLHAGVDGLMHVFLDKAPADSNWIELCKQNNLFVNPTLSTAASQTKEGQAMQDVFYADSLAQKMLFDTRPGQPLGMAGDSRTASKSNAYEAARQLYQAGVPLIVGSDSSGQIRGTPYGLGVHMEMYNLKHGLGMSAVEVLAAATSVPADRFGFTDR